MSKTLPTLGTTKERTAIKNITFGWEFIDPEKATIYLGLNTKNRKSNNTNILKISGDMMNDDRWFTTGTPIQFGLSGRLLDGQNRLYAIITAGVGHWVLVVRGVDDRAQKVIDIGQSRSLTDTMTLDGRSHGNGAAATLNFLLMYRVMQMQGVAIGLALKQVTQMSNAAKLDFLDTLDPIFFDCVSKCYNDRSLNGMMQSAIAAAYYLNTLVNPQRADEALQVLLDGQATYENDAMVAFARWRLRGAGKTVGHNGSSRGTYLMTLLSMWNKFNALEPVQKCITTSHLSVVKGIGFDSEGGFQITQ